MGASWLVLANRASALLFVALMTALFLVRRQRRGGPAPLGGRCVALAGTFLPLWILALPLLHLNPALLTASVLVGWAGLAWSIVSLAVLGRCFGLFPEVRGLVVRGPYALVRHPLYMGEIVTMLGIVGPLLSWRAGIAFALWVGLQVWRVERGSGPGARIPRVPQLHAADPPPAAVGVVNAALVYRVQCLSTACGKAALECGATGTALAGRGAVSVPSRSKRR